MHKYELKVVRRREGGEKSLQFLLQSLKGRSVWREVEGSQPKGKLGENSVKAKTIASFLFRNPAAGVGKLGWKFENQGEVARIGG